MNPEQITISRELAERLFKLIGWHESVFADYLNAGENTGAIVPMSMYSDADDNFKKNKLLPCYTSEEILKWLPCRIWVNGVYYEITLFKADKYWHEDGRSDKRSLTYGFSYEAYKDGMTHCLDIGVYGSHVTSDVSLAEAAGLCLEYLLIHGYIRVEELI